MNVDNSLTRCDSNALSLDELYATAYDNTGVSVHRTENEIQTHVTFPTSCITVIGDGPVNISPTYNVSVDARSQVVHDDRVVRNTENNMTVACGDSAIQSIGNLFSNLLEL